MSRSFGAPAEVVFEVFTNASRYPEYTPIRSVEMERLGDGAPDGAGAIRVLRPPGPLAVRELVTEYERPRLFAFEVISGGGPAGSYKGRLVFVPDAGGGVVVTYGVELEPRVPGTGLAVAAGFRGAIEVLMRLAGPEARRRAAAPAS